MRVLRIGSVVVFLLVATSPRAHEPPSSFTEEVVVEAHYICDGYASFGDAEFYDCARRFFMDGTAPATVAELAGGWRCRSAFNGPSSSWEQRIKIAHYKRKKQGIDHLLVAQVDDGNPDPKRMYGWLQRGPMIPALRMENYVGVIDRGRSDWTSSGWAFGEKPNERSFALSVVELYDARATFRLYRDRLLVEHVVREKEKVHTLEMMNRAPNAVEEMMFRGNAFRPNWTEETLRESRPVAVYGGDWTFPIMYSECRRRW